MLQTYNRACHFIYCAILAVMKFNILLPILILTSCNQNMNEKISPPVCEKHPKVLSIHNDQRTDNYFLVPGTHVPVCAEVVSHMCKAYRVVGA